MKKNFKGLSFPKCCLRPESTPIKNCIRYSKCKNHFEMRQYTFKAIGQKKYSVTFIVLAYLVEVRLGLESIVYKDIRFTGGNALNNCASKYNIKIARSLCLSRLLENDGFFFFLFVYSISFTSIPLNCLYEECYTS